MSVPVDFDLGGRGVGVTGGGGHLGGAMALGLARAGAVVVVCGRNAASLDRVAESARDLGLPGRIVCEPADVRVGDDVDRVLDRLERECGEVRGWVNNAYSGRGGRLLEADEDALRHDVENGVTNVMTATRRVVGRMVQGGHGGSIVNIASMYGMVSPQPATYRDHPDLHNPPAYGVAKAGLIQFTRYAACEFGAAGIRVNAVSPGPFPAEANRRPGFVEELSQRVPLGRVGEAPEVSGAVTFLIGDASSFVTGHNLVVDGGWTAW